jgi:DNA polymerase|tara:strand:+ start:132 stop:1958 length:1827 start_codon:yes stop_codon:yes gene_type:complete
MAYKIGREDVQLWTPTDPLPIFFKSLDDEIIEAHNIFFELCIWNNVGRKKYGFPLLNRENTRCSAAKAASCSLPRSLEGAGKALNLSTTKDESGKLIMLQMSKPRTPTKNNPSIWYNDQARFDALFGYCKKDVEAEHALSSHLGPLDKSESDLFKLDTKINLRGINIDIKTVNRVIFLIEEYTKLQNKKVEEITGGYLVNTTQIAKSIEWILKQGIEVLDLTKDTVSALLEEEEIPKQVKAFLKIRQQLSQTSTKKYESLLEITDTDSRARGLLMYHGASTGRWSGKHFQPHNLPRGTIKDVENAIDAINNLDLEDICYLYGDFMGCISSCLRSMMTAKEGHNLFVADYSSIEARVLVWLCRDEKAIKLFEEDKDLYVDMASTIYKTEKVTKEQRSLGKQAILGLGYGMGSEKFKDTCSKVGVEITKEFSDKVVQTYRNKYDKVKSLWYKIEEKAKKAITTKHPQSLFGITFLFENGNLLCTLPSGRKLTYNQASVKSSSTPWGEKKQIYFMGVNSITKKWEEQTTYGGKLVENIVQAIARDLLAHALTKCEENNYPVIMHVHDEIISEVKEGFVSIDEFESLMCDKPSWAKGLPLKSEGWVGKRYRK